MNKKETLEELIERRRSMHLGMLNTFLVYHNDTYKLMGAKFYNMKSRDNVLLMRDIIEIMHKYKNLW